ncbi:MAG: MFS transporter, partial [Parvibaculum sp.]|nr:MFS transporter [Parvibaculum sp.]
CSLLPSENEQRIGAFLGLNENFAVLPPAELWPHDLDLPPAGPDGYLRLTPASTGTDGFFVAVLRRKDGP